MNTVHVILIASAAFVAGALVAWNNTRSKFLTWIENEIQDAKSAAKEDVQTVLEKIKKLV